MFGGLYIDRIISFIKEDDFDITQLQEVRGGILTNQDGNCFEELSQTLPSYSGALAISWRAKEDPSSYFGNATFYKQEYKLLKKETIWLKPYLDIAAHSNRRVEDDPRSVLALLLQREEKKFWLVNAHLAWSPSSKDEPHKIAQAEKLIKFLQILKEPFILSGDFNIDQHSEIVRKLSTFSQNLTADFGVRNTLNPRVHRAKELFPPGLSVDFIFASKEIAVLDFSVNQTLDLSDHLPLLLTFAL